MSPKRSAFTLIELLVVISIIALLIGILLPALGAARRTARDIQCTSALRQMGIGLYAYSTEYDGNLPISFTNDIDPNSTTANGSVDWAILISSYIQGDGANTYDEAAGSGPVNEESLAANTSGVFFCPSRAIDAGRIHYGANAYTMPVYFNGFFNNRPNGGTPLGYYSVDFMKRTSEIFWIADAGQQVSGTNIGNSFSAMDSIDSGSGDTLQWYSASDTDNEDEIDPGPNEDINNQATISQPRWRHGSGGLENGSDGGNCNVLFGDGHAASTSRSEFLKKNYRPDI